jgi:hypothetical protein
MPIYALTKSSPRIDLGLALQGRGCHLYACMLALFSPAYLVISMKMLIRWIDVKFLIVDHSLIRDPCRSKRSLDLIYPPALLLCPCASIRPIMGKFSSHHRIDTCGSSPPHNEPYYGQSPAQNYHFTHVLRRRVHSGFPFLQCRTSSLISPRQMAENINSQSVYSSIMNL